MEKIVEFSHVSVEFPGVRANDDVSFSVNKGEIFALVGENGAGKSTLMNVLYGIHTPASGEVFVKGEKVTKFDPKEAIRRGIGMVHQHFMLVPSFTVAENIVLSREPKKGILCDRKEERRQVADLSREYGLEVNPDDIVGDLSVGLQQRVEILKTLYRGADVLILDEPTAVLTPQETAELFAVLRRVVAERGMTILLITHKLYEVKEISDRVGVMRRGKLMGIHETASVTAEQLAELMVGREMAPTPEKEELTPGEAALEISDLHADNNRGQEALNGLSLQVRRGEIVGIAAIEGNGQSELLEAVAGMRPYRGKITVNGVEISGKNPGEIRKLGLSHVPEDRLSTGVDKDASVSDNLLAGKEKEPEFSAHGIHLHPKAIRSYAQKLYEAFDIRGAGIDVTAGSLSGGNMQKVVIAREMSFGSQVLLIAQPTRGVDIGAVEFIHGQIRAQRAGGAAILLSSADLDEVLSLSDRILTVYEGKITGEFFPPYSKTEIGLGMTGTSKEAAHE